MALLEVENLAVRFRTRAGVVPAVNGVSFTVDAGETVGLVGESGSGKSVTSLALMGLVPGRHTEVTASRLALDDVDLLALPESELRRRRGRDVAIVFQNPTSSLNPVVRISKQITEALQAHESITRSAARARAAELLAEVGIADPARVLDSYPHRLSGGMCQRVMIAIALALKPRLLIADEPTTALDVTIQAQILTLIERLQQQLGMAVILITHDLGVVAEIADFINVMYAGHMVETGTLEQIFYDPQHPYTWGLLGSIARPDRERMHRLAQIKGQPPSLLAPPEGCHFRPRCPHAFSRCTELPALQVRNGQEGHRDRCWLTPERKQALRVVEGGNIGLEVPA
jgi:oligopeptide/dipeptide ABC transporter ATP-binding protein